MRKKTKPTAVEALMPAVEKLSVSQRRKLIERIGASLPEAVDRAEIPDWHIEVLKKRLADAEQNPAAGTPWREFMEELRKRQ